MSPQHPLFAAPLALLLAGCVHRGQPIVAVPEAIFRAEAAPQLTPPENAYHLKLESSDRASIERFLVAGGNTNNTRNTGVAPSGSRDFKGLLDLLTERKWLYEDVLDRHAFGKFVDGCQVGDAVDARLPFPLIAHQIVCKTGPYYWIFYQHGHELTGLMVFKVSTTPASPRKI